MMKKMETVAGQEGLASDDSAVGKPRGKDDPLPPPPDDDTVV